MWRLFLTRHKWVSITEFEPNCQKFNTGKCCIMHVIIHCCCATGGVRFMKIKGAWRRFSSRPPLQNTTAQKDSVMKDRQSAVVRQTKAKEEIHIKKQVHGNPVSSPHWQAVTHFLTHYSQKCFPPQPRVSCCCPVSGSHRCSARLGSNHLGQSFKGVKMMQPVSALLMFFISRMCL